MRGLAIGMSVLAACYSPAAPLQVPCSPTGECPADQMCLVGTCVAIGAGVPDGDHDGRSDIADNCPQSANPDQTDEDSDQIGDVCDTCPMVSQGDAADSDGDGIPDPCDPDVAMASRDSLWLFYGFQIGVPPWEGSAGWTPASDQDSLRVHAPGAEGDDEEYLDLPVSKAGRALDNFSIRVALTIEEPLGVYPEIGLSLDGSNASVDCTLSQVADRATERNLGLADDFTLDDTRLFLWQKDVAYTLTVVRRGTSYTCTVAGPGGSATRTGTSTVVPLGASLWAYGVTATVDWIYVVGGP